MKVYTKLVSRTGRRFKARLGLSTILPPMLLHQFLTERTTIPMTLTISDRANEAAQECAMEATKMVMPFIPVIRDLAIHSKHSPLPVIENNDIQFAEIIQKALNAERIEERQNVCSISKEVSYRELLKKLVQNSDISFSYDNLDNFTQEEMDEIKCVSEQK